MVRVAEGDRRDLQRLPEERWQQLRVPDGWQPVADICLAIREEVAASVTDTVDAIRAEVPLYRNEAIPRDDLIESVERNLEMLLLGIAERRPPTSTEIEIRSALGNRRAHQGFPVDALLQAFHVGYRDLWRRFLKYADGDEVSDLLLGAATTMWEWTHRVTDGIGRAHAETSQLLAVRTTNTRHRFLELLLAGQLDGDEMLTLCRTLGFDADGRFAGSVICVSDNAEIGATRLQAELDRLKGVHQVVPHGGRSIVLSQDGDQDEFEDVIADLLPRGVVGIGFVRQGLRGARLSVGDAERAAAAAGGPGVHSFATSWAWAVLAREHERLDGFLEDGRRVARENPPLAETVEAFANHDFSVTAAARKLHIHPNTATYRLDRWRELTGWDPRTFEGLLRSLAALRIPT
ncbi:MAG: helix-turn-helix domain-containing protein [Nitriliruptorales bacterium]|nr:helix-turn-helix domain-containing protein [Nitriliruptorales bacterium]